MSNTEFWVRIGASVVVIIVGVAVIVWILRAGG